MLGVGLVGPGAGTVRFEILANALRDRQLLLVLDNAEHVVDVVAELVDGLLRAAPGLRVLVTTREPGPKQPSRWRAGPLDRRSAAPLLAAAGIDAPAVDVLRDLVDRSLLVADRHGRTTRFRRS